MYCFNDKLSKLKDKRKILEAEISEYYTNKINLYGATGKGVDWSSEESQIIRFDQLSKVLEEESGSIIDFGCGYGAYFDYLKNKGFENTYYGIDISDAMLSKATEKFQLRKGLELFSDLREVGKKDYVIASGIFNIRNGTSDENWIDYVESLLLKFDQYSNKGFAFNMLTSYSDEALMKDYLFYANSLKIFDLCKRKYSKNVALLHDYKLYEFTIIVRK